MSKKNGKGPYAANLRQAQNVIKVLFEQKTKAESQQRQCIAILGAILEQFHGGKVDVQTRRCMKWQNLENPGITFNEQKAFGIVRVEARERLAPSLAQVSAPVPTAEPDPGPESSTVCEGSWHSDANAMGVMCPECGGKGKTQVAD